VPRTPANVIQQRFQSLVVPKIKEIFSNTIIVSASTVKLACGTTPYMHIPNDDSHVFCTVSLFPEALQTAAKNQQMVTLLGYGALLSEASSRLTFPRLENFRHVRVKGLRRVFGHPHLFFLRENLLDPQTTLRLASLAAEPVDDDDDTDYSFVVAAFDVQLDDTQREQFIAREPEYKITSVPYYELLRDKDEEEPAAAGMGVICIQSRDEDLPFDIPPVLLERGGVWHWTRDSGLLPSDVYLRHCLLAVQKNGNGSCNPAEVSFLHDTYLADRTTTLAQYLETHSEEIMNSRPPPEWATRFGG
jgi:hypothetical protein